MSKSQDSKYQNFIIVLVALLVIGMFLGPNAGQIYTGISTSGDDSVTITNNGNLDTRVSEYSLQNTLKQNKRDVTISNVGSDSSLYNYRHVIKDRTDVSGMESDFSNVFFYDNAGNEILQYRDGNDVILKLDLLSGDTTILEDWSGASVSNGDFSNTATNDHGVPGAVMHLKFDEGTGTTAYNAIDGGKNDGVFVGTPLWESGVIGSGLKFNDIVDYLDVGNDTSLDVTDAWTYVMRVKFGAPVNDTISNNIILLQKGDFKIDVMSRTGMIYLHGVAGLADTNVQFSDINAWDADTEYFLAASYDSSLSSGNHQLYVNDLVREQSNTGSQLVVSNPLIIGGSGAESFVIHLDELMIFNRALTSDEVELLYHARTHTANTVGTVYSDRPSSSYTDPGITVGADEMYYDGDLIGKLTFSNGDYTINGDIVTRSVKGSIPVIPAGQSQKLVVDHGLEYEIGYTPQSMEVFSADMFTANEDLSVQTRLVDTAGNVLDQPEKIRVRLFDAAGVGLIDNVVDMTSFVIPGEHLAGGHYQLRLSYYGWQFDGWSNEILADFDMGIQGFHIESSAEKAPGIGGTLGAVVEVVTGLIDRAIDGWLDVPVISDIIRFIAGLVGVTL